jgi:tRNA(Ile)-lysidine synthase
MNGSLVNKRIAEALQRLPQDQNRFILAVSGGPDSQCLLKAFPHVMMEVCPLSHCIAVGVNHGLREEAEQELGLARDLALSQQVPFTRLRVRVAAGSSVQAKARDARYEALRAYAGSKPNAYIVTAHHFDDRAETVLIRLLRGKRIGSMAVMPEVSGQIFRPMLKVRRKEIDSYLGRWKLSYATDPSNSDTKYLRTRVRNELLPSMESMSPRIRERLNDIADEALSQVSLQAKVASEKRVFGLAGVSVRPDGGASELVMDEVQDEEWACGVLPSSPS